MYNLFKKKKWEDHDFEIYHRNLDIIRQKFGIKRKEDLSRIIDKSNLYRKDMDKPGESTILKLNQKFEVTTEWLSVDRTRIDLSGGETPMEKIGKALDDEAEKAFIGTRKKKRQSEQDQISISPKELSIINLLRRCRPDDRQRLLDNLRIKMLIYIEDITDKEDRVKVLKDLEALSDMDLKEQS